MICMRIGYFLFLVVIVVLVFQIRQLENETQYVTDRRNRTVARTEWDSEVTDMETTYRSRTEWDSEVLRQYFNASLHNLGRVGHKICIRLYIVKKNGRLMAGRKMVHTSDTNVLPVMMRRQSKVEFLIRRGLSLRRQPNYLARWPALRSALDDGGIPFVFDCSDNSPPAGCNLKGGGWDIPSFTFNALSTCRRSVFLSPSYALKDFAAQTREELESYMARNRHAFPWSDKQRMAIWRGTSTGSRDPQFNRRIQLVKMVQTNQELRRFADVGITRIEHANCTDAVNALGGLTSFIPSIDFQKYRAIIDIDGNAWSSRFASLLCMTSVVLKVESSYVEYFYDQLEPWVHYIPVKNDLSDLLERLQWVMDDANDREAQNITNNAQKWCSQFLLLDNLAMDYMDVLNDYSKQIRKAGFYTPIGTAFIKEALNETGYKWSETN